VGCLGGAAPFSAAGRLAGGFAWSLGGGEVCWRWRRADAVKGPKVGTSEDMAQSAFAGAGLVEVLSWCVVGRVGLIAGCWTRG